MKRAGWIVATVMLFSLRAAANEEAPAHGGGAAEKKDLPEWVQIQANVSVLRGKIATLEKTIKDLIHEKSVEKNPHKLSEIITHLKHSHKELTESAEEYAKAISALKYRYPEVGLKEKENYRRVEVKSLDQMESDLTLEGQIKKTTAKIKSQYGVPAKEERPVRERPRTQETHTSSEGPSPIEPPIMAK